MQFSSRSLILFVNFGLILAVATSLYISRRLGVAVSQEVQAREVDLLFGAIESGPMAIAKLHSAALAQQELERLMSAPQLSDRGLVSAAIVGGLDEGYQFAIWKSAVSVSPECLDTTARKFEAAESLHPFFIRIARDRCHVQKEEKTIFFYSALASSLIAVLASFLILAAIWPAASSIRTAEDIFSGANPDRIGNIYFTPIRRLLQKALRSAELERRQAILTMASQVSHDIRSPLSALNLVLGSVTGLDKQQASVIKSATARINDIAGQLLQNVKQNARSAVAPVDLGSLLDAVIREKQLLFPSVAIKLQTNHVAAKTSADPVELARALANLLTNALEASSTNGKVEIFLKEEKRALLLQIRDTGRGIPKNVLRRLGEEGLTYGKDATQSGTGLGVAHAFRTVDAAGGRIKIKSKLGVGTTIEIRLNKVET